MLTLCLLLDLWEKKSWFLVNCQPATVQLVNPLLHMLFFRSWHNFLFLDNIEKINKSLSKVLNTFEDIMENGAFAPMELMLLFHNIFKFLIFQTHQKALVWSKGLNLLAWYPRSCFNHFYYMGANRTRPGLNFLISQSKHMLWVLKRTVLMRRFFWATKTYVKNDG